MTCDICNKESGDDIILGRWLAYCNKCKEIGKQKDWDLTYENEVSPRLDSGDIDDMDGELEEMIMYNM